jgi:hypothetical protein
MFLNIKAFGIYSNHVLKMAELLSHLAYKEYLTHIPNLNECTIPYTG